MYYFNKIKEAIARLTYQLVLQQPHDDGCRIYVKHSLTTIKNYASKNGYGVFNVSGDACVVKQFAIDDYAEIKKKLDRNSENKGNETMDKICSAVLSKK